MAVLAWKIWKLRAMRAFFVASIGFMPLVLLGLLLGALLPRVDSPWPESIGLGFPFAVAGAAGVIVGVVYAEAPAEVRNRRIRKASRLFFLAGGALYALSLVVQVLC